MVEHITLHKFVCRFAFHQNNHESLLFEHVNVICSYWKKRRRRQSYWIYGFSFTNTQISFLATRTRHFWLIFIIRIICFFAILLLAAAHHHHTEVAAAAAALYVMLLRCLWIVWQANAMLCFATLFLPAIQFINCPTSPFAMNNQQPVADADDTKRMSVKLEGKGDAGRHAQIKNSTFGASKPNETIDLISQQRGTKLNANETEVCRLHSHNPFFVRRAIKEAGRRRLPVPQWKVSFAMLLVLWHFYVI